MFRRYVRPGLILKPELEELGITPTRFARLIDVPPNRVSHIVAGKRSVTGDTALRIALWFGMEPACCMNLQAQFDLGNRRQKNPGKVCSSFQPRQAYRALRKTCSKVTG